MIAFADRVGLRAVNGGDLSVLERIDFDAEEDVGYRYRGTAPDPRVRRERLWGARVLDQRVVLALPSGVPIGYATIYDQDLRSGHGWLAVVARREHRGNGYALLGSALMITHAFREWPLRRIYCEATTQALEQYRSTLATGDVRLVGTFADARRQPDGSFTDVHWLEITKQSWNEGRAKELLPFIDWSARLDGTGDRLTTSGSGAL